MIAALVAGATGLACIAASLSRLRAVRAAPAPGVLAELGPDVTRERLRAFGTRTAEASVARAMVDSVLDAPSRRFGVAELDEHLSDLRRAIDRHVDTPRAAARISLAAGGASAVAELARALGERASGSVAVALVASAAGIVCALVVANVGRMADRRARELKDGWDRAVRSLARALPNDAEVSEATSRPVGNPAKSEPELERD